jgi:predicted RNA-binding Zn ribbon-like protein
VETVVQIEARVVGRRDANLMPRSLVLPFASGVAVSLRSLLDAIIEREVTDFEARQESRSLTQLHDEAEVTQWLRSGKVAFAQENSQRQVDVGAAKSAAHLAFDDGLFQVIIDDVTVDSLDDLVVLKPATQLLLLRLVALAGG